MGFNFKKVAEDKGLVRGGILAGRTPASLETIMGEVVTITGLQPVFTRKDGVTNRKPAIVFKEYPNAYFPTGAMRLVELFASWANELGCPVDSESVDAGYFCVYKNYDALTDEIVKQGGIPICLKFTRSTKGHNYVDFDLI